MNINCLFFDLLTAMEMYTISCLQCILLREIRNSCLIGDFGIVATLTISELHDAHWFKKYFLPRYITKGTFS